MNPASKPDPASPQPIALHEHAEDNLRYIRATMENATSFTGVSGRGYILAGLSALIAAWLAARQSSQAAWLLVWMLELLLAAVVALGMTARKASHQGKPLWSSSGRKLLLAFIPAMTAGGVLTLALFLRNNTTLLPGIWLSLYGAGVMTAGVWSVRILPLMGGLFLCAGALVLLTPVPPDLMLGLGFGGLHILFGAILWRNHGG
jgi:hypothetical protein